MFTGLVEEVGRVISLCAAERGTQLKIIAPQIALHAGEGESVAVNGCCLTICSIRGEQLIFDLLAETLARTNLRLLRAESSVNLERALSANGRFGGHFVQGHIDCTVPVLSAEMIGADLRLEITLPPEFAHYVIAKGSVAVNGVSLTISEISANSFVVWIIPHTRCHTNFETLAVGDFVNLEFDLFAKYVERMQARRSLPNELA